MIAAGLPVVFRQGKDNYKKNHRVIVKGRSFKLNYRRSYTPKGRRVGQKYNAIPGFEPDTDFEDPMIERELTELLPILFNSKKKRKRVTKRWKRTVIRDDDTDETEKEEEKEIKTEEIEIKTEEFEVKKEEETAVQLTPDQARYAQGIAELLALFPSN